ncbi:uncharacterized protein LOC142161990 [Nicotiana tabacum]|uniref:Uncharacterized protein LOC142161990 n=1 Tax=Nicotiana tabacum TaxID=4097 RepID=A0AC58RNT6_TOBAC
MEIFAKAYDVKVWSVIKRGNYPLPAATPPLADPEDIDLYTKEQMEVVQVNNKARNLLHNAISGEGYEKISSCDIAKEMWDKLEVTYEGTSKIKEIHINMLVHDYELFSMKKREYIEEMFARFSKIISDLKAFGKPYTSGDQLLKRRISRRSTEIAENEIDDDLEALQEEIDMLSRNMNGLMRRFQNTKKDILDLTLKESQKLMNELKRLTKEVKDWKLKHEVCEIEKEILQEEFEELQMQLNGMHKSTSYSSVSVKFGDDSKGKIIGTGTIPSNNKCDITEVYLVDGLNYNLLSISQLCDSGYEVNFKKTSCAIGDESGKIVLPGKRYENVYILDGFEKIDGYIFLTSMSDDPWLWHRKLGQASMHLIEKLSKHELVVGLPKLNFSRTHICDACHMGKQTRNSFKNKDIVSTSKPLQLLHMNLFGPTRTANIGGKRYAFVIVDDYSRFTWVIFLSHKDEALRYFEVFCKKVEREKGYLISTIQSDHGGEFESRAFEDFYNDQGYTHNFSAPR